MVRKPLYRIVRWFSITLLILYSAYYLLLLGLSIAPKPTLYSWQSWSTAYFDQSDQLLRLTLADDDKYRIHTELADISEETIQAALLYEDKDFYEHSGVSVTAIFRAFWHTYVVKSRQIGGSTISMQLARMAFDIESRTIPGKLQQILYALWIERHYSKQEILERYLNNLPYGGNIEGITAASLIYFDKLPNQLNTAEALALAIIPQNPSKRYPITEAGYQRMNAARLRLAERWLENPTTSNGSSQDQQLKQWLDIPLHFRSLSELPFHAPHFVEYLAHNHKRKNRVTTSLNLNTQHQFENIIGDYLLEHRQLGYSNASALLLNHQTMEVEAWVGSADYFNSEIFGQVDGVTAKRSPGSTLKPLAYSLALNQGLIHPLSLLKDTPSRFAAYTPENYDLAYAGPINATEALITSRNVPAIRLAAQLNTPTLYQLLTQTGISELKPREHYGLSAVLGGVEVSMQELIRLYAMLANEGRFQHESVFVDQPVNPLHAKALLSPESAWLTGYMLAQNPATDQTPAARASYFISTQDQKIAWKTGTSFAFRDAWSVGYDQNYVLGVWLGNFNGEGNSNLVGRKAAAPLFFKLFRSLSSSSQNTYTPPPEDLKKVEICEATGDLPGVYCPNTIEGWFIPGVSPIKTSNVFRPVLINQKTGKRACEYQDGVTKQEVFQFWPSDLASLFNMAGIQHRQPPEYESKCMEGNQPVTMGSTNSSPPKITSPSAQLTYYLSEAGEEIPLEAILDSDVQHAYWFANGSFIGEASTNETLFWKANPGVYQLTITDDQGKTDSLELTVDRINQSLPFDKK